MARVLWLTGFGPFARVEANPTAAVVTRLHGEQVADLEVVSEVLPMSFARAADRVTEVFQRLRPAAALHLALALPAEHVLVESTAANERTSSLPDVDGAIAFGEACSSSLPLAHRLRTRVDTARVAERLQRRGLAARTSADAGRYVCNHTYFHTLKAASVAASPPLVLMLHLPAVGNRRAAGGARWSLDELSLAARVAMLSVTDQLTGRVTGPRR